MKWLLYLAVGLVGVVLLAVIVLLALGGGRGESSLVASVDIGRPAHVVYTWISQPERLKSWVGWLVDIHSLTPGEVGAGARQVWVMEDRNNNNQRMDIHTEMTRVEPGRVLVANLTAKEGFTGDVTYELQPLDAGSTRLLYRASYKFDHWLAKLMEPLITRSAQQKLEEDLARLKQKAEAE
jgi:uncharacterized protein YndB with AHSA1/START domain